MPKIQSTRKNHVNIPIASIALSMHRFFFFYERKAQKASSAKTSLNLLTSTYNGMYKAVVDDTLSTITKMEADVELWLQLPLPKPMQLCWLGHQDGPGP